MTRETHYCNRDSSLAHQTLGEQHPMKKKSGDPRKRQTEVDYKTLKARQLALLMSKEKETKAETMRLMELFEEQYPESPGFLYDETPYMLTLGAIVIHRAGCELKVEPEKYNVSEQLDVLELLPEMRKEIEEFLIRNQLNKAETYSVFSTDHA